MRVFTIFTLALSAMLCRRTWVLVGLRGVCLTSEPGEVALDSGVSSSATLGDATSSDSFSPGLGDAAIVSPSEEAL